MKRKILFFALIACAVLIPTAFGLLILSNQLNGNFLVFQTPATIKWVTGPDNYWGAWEGNAQTYNVSITNVNYNIEPIAGGYLTLNLTAPTGKTFNATAQDITGTYQRASDKAWTPITSISYSSDNSSIAFNIGPLPPISIGSTYYEAFTLYYNTTAPGGQYKYNLVLTYG